MEHDDLVEKAEKAITDIFNDKSVSQSETRDSLNMIIGNIQDMINTLET